MAEPLRNSAVLVFDEFLAYLRQQGFVIGVDHYLRLQELLNKISGECGPGELSTLLCPIFATSHSQQEKFYRAFNSFFALLQSAPAATRGSVRGEEQTGQSDSGVNQSINRAGWKKPANLSAALGVLLVAAALAFWLINPGPIQNKNENINQQTNQNQNANQDINTNSENRNNQNRNSNRGETGNKNDNPAPTPSADSTARPNVSSPSPPALLGPELRTFIRIAATGAPVILFLLYEYVRYRRRKLVLQKKRAKKPPFVYALRIEPPAHKIFNSEQFYTAARRMRRRQTDKFHRLDVRATVEATTRSLGYPSFRYKADSKIPEYLVLIDRASFRDHQAQLFENLARALKQEGLYVTTYFYDGDPRICRSSTGKYIQLSELQNKHADDRLLIFGDGDKLIDPLTGDLEPWTSGFLYWPDRGVLTPEALWGLRESSLAKQFALVPANLSGLLAVVDYFENGAAIDARLLTRNGHGSLPDQFDQSVAIKELRNYLGEKTFQWLCACAVYPELQWGLTLYLGSLPCMEADLITEDSLLRLASLPWFRNGMIPDEIRLSLIHELDKEKERAIRAAIIELLERTPPARRTKETFAADSYELNLAVESWFYHLDDSQRTRLRKVIVRLPQKEVFRDYTLIRFLESAPRTQLALLLPKKLRAIFYPSAMPEFGMRNSARLVLTAILVAIVWFGLNWLMPPLSKAKILDFSASAKTITAGETVKLFYGVSNASGVRIDPQPGDVEVLEQNVIEAQPAQTTTYWLTATDGDGRKVSQELSVEVDNSSMRIVSFGSSPPNIVEGQSAQLCYQVRNAKSVQIYSDPNNPDIFSRDFGEAQPPYDEGCIKVVPVETTRYTLTATDMDGQFVRETFILVVFLDTDVRIISFSAAATIHYGESTNLCFKVANANVVKITTNFGEEIPIKNNCATVAPKQTTIYTLKATGSNGQQEQSRTVTVVPPDKPVIDEFTATPPVIAAGEKVQLCYRVRNVDQVEVSSADAKFTWRNITGGRTCTSAIPKQTTTYTLKATSTNFAQVLAEASVEVKPNPIPIGQITVAPSAVIAGEAATLCVKVVGGTRPYVIVNPSPAPIPTFGGYYQACAVFRLTETIKLTVIVTDASGQTATRQITVEVKQPTSKPPRILSFTASPSVVAPGEQVKLCYEVENADGVTFSWSASEKTSRLIKVSERYKTSLIVAQQGVPQQRSPLFVKGSKNCIPFGPTRTTTYTIKATNNSGEDSKSVTVAVRDAGEQKQQQQQQEQTTPPSPTDSTRMVTLTGRVVDESGNGISKATIRIESANGKKRQLVSKAQTQKDGLFSITFPEGNYRLTVSEPGFTSDTKDIGFGNVISPVDGGIFVLKRVRPNQ